VYRQDFSFLHVVPSYPMGTGAVSPAVKMPGREAGRSPPTNDEVRNTWVYASSPPIRYHSMVLN
jgi:hypothetical protein